MSSSPTQERLQALIEKVRRRQVALSTQLAIVNARARSDVRLDRDEFRAVLTSESTLLSELETALLAGSSPVSGAPKHQSWCDSNYLAVNGESMRCSCAAASSSPREALGTGKPTTREE